MHNSALTFNFSEQPVRVLEREDGLWWVAADVCRALEILNSRDAVASLDEDDVATTDIIDALGRTQQANVVSESGLYSLIFTSRKEKAREFKRWVTREVLPSIRRTGRFAVDGVMDGGDPDFVTACDALEELAGTAGAAARRVMTGVMPPEAGQVVSSLCAQAVRAWEVRLRVKPAVLPLGDGRPALDVGAGLAVVAGGMKESADVSLAEIYAASAGDGELSKSMKHYLGWLLREWRGVRLRDAAGRGFRLMWRRAHARYWIEFEARPVADAPSGGESEPAA